MLLKYIDFTIQGYHKKLTYDTKGDLVKIEYFQNYDGVDYSDLKVTETRVFTRNITTGLVETRTNTIVWNDKDQTQKIYTKYYDLIAGYEANKNSRTILINNASMYLLSQIGLVDGKLFLDLVSNDISTYIGGSSQPLLDSIANSTEIYMTAQIKATLDVILNIIY